MPRTLPLRRGAVVTVVGLGLLASACSSGGSPTATAPGAAAAEELAADNIDDLASSDNVLDIEVLDVADGAISTLRAAVDGDRPVLLWFYSPH